MTDFSPREIVSELDRFIIGQGDAKRAVAIALRNRWRRLQLDDKLREEVLPKNILMIGPTGVGKTEISRRLARLAGAPFIKVEATKFTEVGYVGRDVEQIARDLVEEAVRLEKERRREAVKEAASHAATERLLDALTGKDASAATRESFRKMLGEGHLDAKEVEIDLVDQPSTPFEIPGMGGQVGMINLSDLMGKAMGQQPRKKRKLAVRRRSPRWSRRNPTSASTSTTSTGPRSRTRKRTASSSSTRSTRSRSPTCAAARSAERASSAICCP